MLASRATAGNGNARAAFLQLPSQLRQLSHQQSSRSFSASASRKVTLVDIAAAPPLTILNGLHGIGIPWYAAIPTAAILIRGIFGYYFSSKPSRKREQIRNNLAPLMSADILLSLRNDHPDKRFRDIPPLFHIKKRFSRAHEVGKIFGAPLISWSTPVNFGGLLATAEAVRMKCGAREGLLSTVLSPFEWLVSIVKGNPSSPSFDREARAQELAERMEQARQMRLQQAQEQTLGADGQVLSEQSTMSENLFHPSDLPAPPRINVDSLYFDPTLQTEGFFWCTDLVAIDPYHILPFATTAVMLSNILLNPSPVPRPFPGAQKLPEPVRFFLTRYGPWQKFSMGLACAFGYIMQEMPAAIVLYVFSSVVTGFVQRRWLELRMPLRKPIMPCRRGTRVRSKKEWSARA
jgi:inner membrane protein COX18